MISRKYFAHAPVRSFCLESSLNGELSSSSASNMNVAACSARLWDPRPLGSYVRPKSRFLASFAGSRNAGGNLREPMETSKPRQQQKAPQQKSKRLLKADPTNKGRVDGAIGAAVLKKSKLKESVLHKVALIAQK